MQFMSLVKQKIYKTKVFNVPVSQIQKKHLFNSQVKRKLFEETT